MIFYRWQFNSDFGLFARYESWLDILLSVWLRSVVCAIVSWTDICGLIFLWLLLWLLFVLVNYFCEYSFLRLLFFGGVLCVWSDPGPLYTIFKCAIFFLRFMPFVWFLIISFCVIMVIGNLFLKRNYLFFVISPRLLIISFFCFLIFVYFLIPNLLIKQLARKLII